MFSVKSAAFAAVTLVLMSGSVAMSQHAGNDRLNNHTAQVNTNASSSMNIQEIGQMLKNLGYQFKTVTRQNGVVVHELDVPSPARVVFVDISLSQDGTKLWFQAVMSTPPSGQNVPSHIMQKLLETNNIIGPNFFSFGTNNSIRLQSPLDNRHLTPEDLRKEIDIFVQLTNQTESLWNFNKWGTR